LTFCRACEHYKIDIAYQAWTMRWAVPGSLFVSKDKAQGIVEA